MIVLTSCFRENQDNNFEAQQLEEESPLEEIEEDMEENEPDEYERKGDTVQEEVEDVEEEGENLAEETLDEIVKAEYNIPDEYRRYIIVFEADSRWDKAVIEQYNGVIINEAETVKMVSAYLPEHLINRIREHPKVLSIEPDQLVVIEEVNWGYDRVRTYRAHNGGLTGKGVKIAVIDSGIFPHFSLSIAGGASFVNYTTSYVDDNGHGTHVAGIIGANALSHGLLGIAPEASIYALKTLHQNGSGFLSDTIAAIDWSIANKMDIINLSLGMERDSFALKNAVDKAYENNILVVASAGNFGTREGSGDTTAYPAKYPSTIAVAATDQNNNRAPFSSTGPTVEISAPGSNIYSTTLNHQFTTANGTSAAAPYVSGVLALIKEGFPHLNARAIRNKLQREVMDLGTIGRDSWFGYGLVQAPKYFRDIRGHWALHDILRVNNFGWMRGTGNDNFSPEQNLTRAQGAVVLVRALGLRRLSNNPSPFVDINHWAKNEMEIIHQHNLMRGTTTTTFSPETPMTREQMAVILARALELNRTSEMNNPFRDVREGHWATNDIIATTHHRIFGGLTPNTFGGSNIINRAQMAALMSRISNQLELTS